MIFKFFFRQGKTACFAKNLAVKRNFNRLSCGLLVFFGIKQQTGFPAAQKFQIDFGKQLGIKQRSVQCTIGVVNVKTFTKCVQIASRTGKQQSGNFQRINYSVPGNLALPQLFKLIIDKVDIKRCIMGNQYRISDKIKPFVGNFVKSRIIF